MTHLQRVMARREATRKHYERGGFPDNAPRPVCETCADEGYTTVYHPTWTQTEQGGFIEAAVGWVECPDCTLSTEMMNAAAVEAAAS